MMKLFGISLILVGIMCFAYLISGCGVTTRSPSKPAFDNLSGTYRYVGLGSFTPSDFPNPLIEFADITAPCDVEVSQEGRVFTVLYRSSIGSPVRGTVDLNKRIDGVSWEDNELVTTKRVPVSGPVILPLPGRHYRGTRLFRDKNGNLVIIGFFKERGLFWTDYSEEEIILQRRKD